MYVNSTGDTTIWDEVTPFIQHRELRADEEDLYDLPQVSSETGTVYQHCLQAIRRGFTTGKFGLPLMGTGDWNDGMNSVGRHGKGTSVWLAWFCCAVCSAFLPHANEKGDARTVDLLKTFQASYAEAANRTWTGEWYTRAYYDNGHPLGAPECLEAKIDCIAQAWSVISGEANPLERGLKAMESVDHHLVATFPNRNCGLIRLLAPAFGTAPEPKDNPGYIASYLPGVRENGAQYTHASFWVILANLYAHRGDRAFELFDAINPLSHTATAEGVHIYKTEPYVLAADIYFGPNLDGRGGWTWYTGSASWGWKTAVEALCGLEKVYGTHLRLQPCIPSTWSEYTMIYRVPSPKGFDDPTPQPEFHITVLNPSGLCTGNIQIELDGTPLEGKDSDLIPLNLPPGVHKVKATLVKP